MEDEETSLFIAEQSLCPIACQVCGVAFAVPALYLGHKARSKRCFYCPNGCKNRPPVLSATSDAEDQMAAKIERLEAQIEELSAGKT